MSVLTMREARRTGMCMDCGRRKVYRRAGLALRCRLCRRAAAQAKHRAAALRWRKRHLEQARAGDRERKRALYRAAHPAPLVTCRTCGGRIVWDRRGKVPDYHGTVDCHPRRRRGMRTRKRYWIDSAHAGRTVLELMDETGLDERAVLAKVTANGVLDVVRLNAARAERARRTARAA